jgi:superfamily II DNA or RNA helicase
MNIKTLINNSDNYIDLHNQLTSLSDKKKGDLFEEFCVLVFKFHPFYKNITKEVYLLKDTPKVILDELNLPQNDIGIDAILVTNDNKYCAVQVKFRSNRNIIVDYKRLGTFVGTAFGIANNISQAFYFCNTYGVSNILKRSTKIVNIHGDFFDNLSENLFLDMKNHLNGQKRLRTAIMPRSYQREIIDTAINYFATENKGYLEMMCGTGKSLTSYWIDDALGNNLTVILVPSLYLLSQFYTSYCYQAHDEGTQCKFILVGSDMDVDEEITGENVGLLLTTDPIEICQSIDPEQKTVIISTYQSSDNLLESLKMYNLKVDLCIYDEAHKTVGNTGKKWNVMVTNDDIVIKKKLFMTATPKVYNYGRRVNIEKAEEDQEESNEESDEDSGEELDEDTDEDELDEDSDEESNEEFDEDCSEEGLQVLSMCNKEIYGKLIYKYSACRAITEGYLNDYRIVTLYTDNAYIKNYLSTKKYVRVADIDQVLYTNYLASALMILNAFEKDECNHLVTYHNSVKNAKIFLGILEGLKGYYAFVDDVSLQQLDGSLSMNLRNKIVNDFKTSKYGIICSCRALNEGVDIPIIDSICFCDDRNSTIDIVQCIGRGLRLFKGKGLTKVLVPVVIKNMDIDKGNFSGVIKILKSLNNTDLRIVEYFKERDNNLRVNFITGYNFNSAEVLVDLEDLEVWKEGIEIVLWQGVDGFEYMYGKLIKYIEKYNKIPNQRNNDYDTRCLYRWYLKQKRNSIKCRYTYNKLSNILVIKQNIDEYIDLKNKNIKKINFQEMQQLLFEYCDIYKEAPKHNTYYKNYCIGSWLNGKKQKIKSFSDDLYVRLAKNIFVKQKIDMYFDNKPNLKNKICFDQSLNFLNEYITKYDKVPVYNTQYKSYNIGSWLHDQKKKINNKECDIYIKLSKNELIKDMLDNYLVKISKKTISVKLSFDEICSLLFEYCNNHKQVPKQNTVYRNYNIGSWIRTQKRKSPSNTIKYNKLIKNSYVKYFLEYNKEKDYDYNYNYNTSLLFEYCNIYNKIPAQRCEYKGVNIGKWLSSQKPKINNIDDEIYIKLSKNSIVKHNLDNYLQVKYK